MAPVYNVDIASWISTVSKKIKINEYLRVRGYHINILSPEIHEVNSDYIFYQIKMGTLDFKVIIRKIKLQ